MKYGTENKLKFKVLKRMLKLPLWQVKGLLQSIWDFTAENAMIGDIGRFTDAQIALGIEFDGDAAKLVHALVESGWLERSRAHRLIVHDWSDHCEDWIRKRVKRSGLEFAKSDNPEKMNSSENIELDVFSADNGGQRRQIEYSGGLPTPTPTPTPIPSTPPNPRKRGKPAAAGADDVPIPDSLRTPRFTESWGLWLKHRRQAKKPLTPTCAEKQLANLEQHSPDVAASMLDQSMLNGWQGIFPLRAETSTADHGGQNGTPATHRPANDLNGATVQESVESSSDPEPTPEARKMAHRWCEILEMLRENFDEETFSTWLEPIACRGLSQEGIWLEVPGDFYRRMIRHDFEDSIAEAAKMVIGLSGWPPVYVSVAAAEDDELKF